MIIDVLNCLVSEINNFIDPTAALPRLALGNIATVNDGDDFTASLRDKLVLSIVNIEEEKLPRSPDNYVKQNNEIIYRYPPLHFNLTLLFASTHSYDTALLLLEKVMQYFQSHPFITSEDTPALAAVDNPKVEKLLFEFVNLNLEQMHQLWTTLGGHYMPSIVIKMRLLVVTADQNLETGKPITEINYNLQRK